MVDEINPGNAIANNPAAQEYMKNALRAKVLAGFVIEKALNELGIPEKGRAHEHFKQNALMCIADALRAEGCNQAVHVPEKPERRYTEELHRQMAKAALGQGFSDGESNAEAARAFIEKFAADGVTMEQVEAQLSAYLVAIGTKAVQTSMALKPTQPTRQR